MVKSEEVDEVSPAVEEVTEVVREATDAEEMSEGVVDDVSKEDDDKGISMVELSEDCIRDVVVVVVVVLCFLVDVVDCFVEMDELLETANGGEDAWCTSGRWLASQPRQQAGRLLAAKGGQRRAKQQGRQKKRKRR